MISLLEHSFHTALKALDSYSNLLLVFITAAYVVLTWQNLKAFERSVLRERESKHLDDIKATVVAPILAWLEEVQAALSGIGIRNVVRVEPAQPNNPKGTLQVYPLRVPIQGLSQQLVADAQKQHFSEELRTYDSFRHFFEKLLDDLAEFGGKCSEELYTTTTLLPPEPNDRLRSFVSCEEIVQAWLRYALCGSEPKYYFQDAYLQGCTSDSAALFIQGTLPAVACDSEGNINSWLPKAFDLIEEHWKREKFGSRIMQTREDGESLRKSILEIQFVQTISGKCKYLGE